MRHKNPRGYTFTRPATMASSTEDRVPHLASEAQKNILAGRFPIPMGSMYGIYANFGGILMGSMLPYIAYMDPSWDMTWLAYIQNISLYSHVHIVLNLVILKYTCKKNYIQQLKVPAYGACIYVYTYSHASHMYIHLNQNTAIWLGSEKV